MTKSRFMRGTLFLVLKGDMFYLQIFLICILYTFEDFSVQATLDIQQKPPSISF